MATQVWVAIAAGCTVALLVALAEWLHARRVQRVRRLAFGPDERPRGWVRWVAPVRALCLGGFAWAVVALILNSINLLGQTPPPPGSATRHVVFVVDLSPSMYLEDAGAKHEVSRRARMAEVIGGVLDRVSGDVTFSVVAFYTDAMPVVMQARDRAVVRNVLDGMPLVYAMAKGQTDLALSINRSLELVRPFPKGKVSLFICTDGDTVAPTQPLVAPPSVDRVTVLGVGDRERGTFIDGHQSRQDANVLRAVASALKAEYVDVNERHVPTSVLGDLVLTGGGSRMSLTQIAILTMAACSTVLAFIPVAQQYLGTAWRVRRGAAGRTSRREAA